MTDTKTKTTLKLVPYIQYSVQFHQKNKDKSKDKRALIDLGSKINAMHFTYITKLGLYTKKINVSTQKINGSHLDTFRLVIIDRFIKNKLKKV